ncbi:MAG: glycoside hydrolase family 16 protein [Pontiellaceae bacterium]|nr:glycoside hydrolase family 16 protein [Pontiellaceae bacterium]MBN2785994.1 glycoside hydrolase family 16 protein [Pontiellaceae bacterium]
MDFKKVLLGLVVLTCSGGVARSELVWSDEFNGSSIDFNTWTYDVGGGGFGNGQLEYDTARSENSYIENGCLVIEARRENYSGNAFTSARMLTQGRFAFKYGSLEARIKLPDTANGLWPAFWLLGNNFPGINWPGCGEIDILEAGSTGGILEGTQHEKINCAIHYSNAAGDYEYKTQWLNASDVLGPVDLSADFHRYRLEWTPTALSFFIDDVQFASWDISADSFSEYHQPHFVILNVAVGGWNYVEISDPGQITAPFPAKMQVDWVRLEDNGYTEIFNGADAAESGAFGVFTETTPVDNALVFGDDTAADWPYSDKAAVYPWENTMVFSDQQAAPSEGSECWTFDVGSAAWCGMGVFLPSFRNMSGYSDGYLHFDIQTTLSDTLKIGIQSSRAGQFWLPLGDESAEFGFARDGAWHSMSIPLNRFANTDFKTIHQIFMLLADSVSSSTTLSIDNIWWEPSVPRTKPASGSYGIFTETETNRNAGAFSLSEDGNFFVWEKTLQAITQDPFEGENSLSFQSAAGLTWFGAAFSPNVKLDLSSFDNPDGKLHVAMKTSSSVTFQLGMKSGNMDGVGQKWIPFAAGSDPYGFARDGQWHAIEIPVADLGPEVDFSEVSQLFQILGTDGPISDIELDDIYFSGGAALQTNVVSSVLTRGVGISWPTESGADYSVQWTSGLGTNTVWSTLDPPVAGDGATHTVFDPAGSHSNRFYRILQLP